MSRSPSALANKFDSSTDVLSASHKNSMFPWDHAGSSSLSGAIFGEGSDRISVGTADVKMRDSSLSRSRRDSSLVPSQMVWDRPHKFRARTSHSMVNATRPLPFHCLPLAVLGYQSGAFDSQLSDNLGRLERNSFNFLEFVKCSCRCARTYESTGILKCNVKHLQMLRLLSMTLFQRTPVPVTLPRPHSTTALVRSFVECPRASFLRIVILTLMLLIALDPFLSSGYQGTSSPRPARSIRTSLHQDG
jgi:hypothetical protein